MHPEQSIGHYKIVSKLGEGGMGAVYRATDTKLNRHVAIKVLPEAFAADFDRLARFTREAQLLASLNHPNIAAIYGVEERALVLELVEGPTLEQRIAAGPVPLDEALLIARQIAEALEYAHERGIVHRDLKPANIKLTLDGRVKVLDFGLAKAMSPDAAPSANPFSSPTLTVGATVAGVILGTVAYMSPEQAKGKPVDRRADIWAFGAVLFEMLTGRPMYAAETVTEMLAAVIMKEPDLALLPAATPAALRAVLARCLDKDPMRRLRDIGEARIALERPLPPDLPAAPLPPAPARASSRLPWIASVLFALAAASFGFVHLRESPPPAPPLRFNILPPEKQDFSRWFVLSPNGKLLAFNTRGGNDIWVRPLDSMEARRLPNASSNTFFWSPDSRFIAFGSEGKIRKVDVAGGLPEPLCDYSGVLLGGSWNSGGTILFGATNNPIMRVSSSGGTAQPVTALDASHFASNHSFPTFLPDGRYFLYLRSAGEHSGIYAASLDLKPEQQSNVRIAATGSLSFGYAPDRPGVPGHLLYVRERSLVAQPFDSGSLHVQGEAVAVAQEIDSSLSLAAFTVSPTGILVYRTGFGESADLYQYHWFDREGKDLGVAGTGSYPTLALSPDASRLAHARSSPGDVPQIWIFDLTRGFHTRLSFTPDGGVDPAWSPDGKWVAFSASTHGNQSIFIKDSGGGASERLIFTSNSSKSLGQWSRDGKYLLFSQISGESGRRELWAIPDPVAEGDHKSILVARSSFSLSAGRISPDSRWIAYHSDQTGKPEVYVRPFPPGDGRSGEWPVSAGGGLAPLWRADGSELYFSSLDGKLMATDVKSSPADPVFHSGIPHTLMATFWTQGIPFRGFDVTRDGRKFLIATPPAPSSSQPLTVVVNWESNLRK